MQSEQNDLLSKHGMWSSRWVFILAAAGSAVGLGNLWKFPYITGENGGGAFVLVYLGCLLLIGLPVLMAETLMGRAGRMSPINSVKHLTKISEAPKFWNSVGYLGVLAAALILSFYSVIAGWGISYSFDFLTGHFNDLSTDQVTSTFDTLLGNPVALLIFHTIFMFMTYQVVSNGVNCGIEKAITYLMPALFVILFILLGYAMSTGYFAQGLHFLFDPDFSQLTWNAVLLAMGHAFFTLSLGMGAIMAYGAYLPNDVSVARASVWVAFADTAIALMAGMAIFPIVFANGLEPGAGPGLIFVTLPVAFVQMDFGIILGTLFFALVVIAAWSSSISMLEPVIAWMIEKWDMSRRKAAAVASIVIWLFGLGTVFSFNIASDVHFLGERTFFDSLDFLTSAIMLPLGGMLMAIFVGWVMKKHHVQSSVGLEQGVIYSLWMFALRFIAPLAVMFVFISTLLS